MRSNFKFLYSSLVVTLFFSLPLIIFLFIGMAYTASPAVYMVGHFPLAMVVVCLVPTLKRISTLLSVCFFLLILISVFFVNLIELVLIHFYGRGFSNLVFIHLNGECLRVGLRVYQRLALTSLIFLIGLVMISLKVLLAEHSFFDFSIPKSLLFTAIFSVLIYFCGGSPVYQILPAYSLFEQFHAFHRSPQRISLSSKDEKLLKMLGFNLNITPKEYLAVVKPLHPMNLIIIYLESFDFRYTEMGRSLYPNLTPQLDEWASKSIFLKNYFSSEGFTMGGVFATLSGILPFASNTFVTEAGGFLHRVSSVTDALKKAGYYQVYICGAVHSGKDGFFMNHGYDENYGWEDWQKNNAYLERHNVWGIYDIDLFREAAKLVTRLQKKKPFNLTILTLDTHMPGFPSPEVPPYSRDPYLNSIHSTDQSVGQFMRFLDKNHYLDDTVVVITSDHSPFETQNHVQLFGKNETNRIIGIIRSPHFTRPSVIDFMTYSPDLAPTILDLLGIESNIHFLRGNSVLKPDPKRRYLVLGNFAYGINLVVGGDREPKVCRPHDLIGTSEIAESEINKVFEIIYDYQRNFQQGQRLPISFQSLDGAVLISNGKSFGENPAIFIGKKNEIFREWNKAGPGQVIPGIYIVTLDPAGTISSRRYFDKSQPPEDWKRCEMYLKAIPKGEIVLLVVGGNGAANFSREAKRLLIDLGARKTRQLSPGSSYILITRKGGPPEGVVELYNSSGAEICHTISSEERLRLTANPPQH